MQEIDAVASTLPMARCDRLTEILTEADIATLKHLSQQGMGENTLRALASERLSRSMCSLRDPGNCLPRRIDSLYSPKPTVNGMGSS